MTTTLFEWRAPGPYRVAFSTRVGGASEGQFASLNLGIKTDDEASRVLKISDGVMRHLATRRPGRYTGEKRDAVGAAPVAAAPPEEE